MDIFGYSISRKQEPPTERSFVAPDDEGAVDLPVVGNSYYGTYLDLDHSARTDQELIKRYRDIALMADVDSAIEDIVNEAIAAIEQEEAVTIDLDGVDGLSDNVKKSVEKEFENVLKLMHFHTRGHDYFRRWYIDGRIYFHKVIDTAKPKEGLTGIRYIDSRKIRKVREILKDRDPRTGVELVRGTNEYYVFDERGSYTNRPANNPIPVTTQPMKVLPDAVCSVTSGQVDQDRNMILSYLHKAIKPANQLRMQENALVIYRLARAPERRIFYIDVGNLPKTKAEQYLKDIMAKYRNKLVYDASTGEIRDDKKNMSMLEDIWLPRKEGGQGTKIDTLPGGQNLGEIGDIEYFQKLLYQSLNVPISRLQQQTGLNFGRSAEITRDELKFTKFVSKLRRRFAMVFLDLLKTQCILKGILTEQDWSEIEQDIRFKYAEDAYYTESKEQEILRSRFELLAIASQFVGQFISREYAMKKILQLSDEEAKAMLEQIGKEPPPPSLEMMAAEVGINAEADNQKASAAEKAAPVQPKKKTGPKAKGPRPVEDKKNG